MTYRSGLISVVGRPNTGKSTLVNALIGEKVAITSSRPQTTRHVIRGVVTRPDAQLVFVDTPGLHKPQTLLGQRLNDEVRHALADVDVIAVTLPADERVGPGDRYITTEAARIHRAPKVAVVTKSDRVKPAQMVAHLASVAKLAEHVVSAGLKWSRFQPSPTTSCRSLLTCWCPCYRPGHPSSLTARSPTNRSWSASPS